MNSTIWKYILTVTDAQNLLMPEGAQILGVQIQHGQVALWALVDPAKPEARRHFVIAGTGNPINTEGGALHYIGTVQQLGGDLVWHVFERKSQ